MAESGMVPPKVWNLSSSLCNACLNGDYTCCQCDQDSDMYKSYKDLSTDSLDQCGTALGKTKTRSRSSIGSGFMFDDEFEDEYEKRQLPPSTTDWDSIDSVLENTELEETDDGDKTPSSRCLSNSFHMQMVFVDSDTDKESIPDVEVYYDNNDSLYHSSGSQGNTSCSSDRNIDSRDSGYITTDVMDLNVEHVTDRKRRTSIEPVEASARVLASLHLHEKHEQKRLKEIEQQRQKDEAYMSEVHCRNVIELQEMKRTLEMRIAQINIDLVQELQYRDELHAHHEALLMEADDLKQTQSSRNTPAKTIRSSKESKATKRRSFWFK